MKRYEFGKDAAVSEEKSISIITVGAIKIYEIRFENHSSGFSLQNIQSSPEGFHQPLRSSRYWTTDPIQTKSFNDFVLFTIRDSILKRVINNRLTGSFWHFNRFNYINIKTTKAPIDNLVR